MCNTVIPELPIVGSMQCKLDLVPLILSTSAMTLHMQKEEQAKTAQMVKEHSKQMLELLAQEKEKLRQELKQEIVRV